MTLNPPSYQGGYRSGSYDPAFDPLVAQGPARGQDHAPTYWAATAGPLPADDGPIAADIDVDVAIIGGGYTGLATAIFLAKEHGIKAAVLEANHVSWGCSSRNGGQAQNAVGRLTRSQWIAKWGVDTAQKLHAEVADGFETFKHLIQSGNIDCEQEPGGHLYIAHRASALKKLEAEAKVLNQVFNYPVRMLDARHVKQHFVNDAETWGALHEPDGIGVHPLKLARGYLRLAREAGATVHPFSAVTKWETRDGRHYLTTPGGIVRARAVGIASGGYTTQGLHPGLRNRFFPVLSNSLVTAPLTTAQIDACNFLTKQVITDTRTLRFYYRKLPDNRLQIGSRSAITGSDAQHPRHLQALIDGMNRKFPALAGIPIDYSWWGWVDLSHDMMPRIFQPEPDQTVYYALGYGGNGVMYSAQAGRRLAQRIAGKTLPSDLPIFTSPLPKSFLAPFRRLGQRALYRWHGWRDESL
jgi:taurine dehydrogenase large subunit